jgi:dTDP-4-dehydrorhamnose 3,5-epimerase
LIFEATQLAGAFLIKLERRQDERGFFARSWCEQEFKVHGLNPRIAQCNISFNRNAGTLRGMHYQSFPYQEVKLVRCTAGSIHDVIIDLRPNSPTFKKHAGFTLSAENRDMLYVPEGFAHGFLTQEDNCELFYQMSESYASEASRGVRWDDPVFGIDWPEAPRIISERDRTYPDYIF